MEVYDALGLMSGTSQDGLDLACCRFVKHEKRWEYEILAAETQLYPVDVKERLRRSETIDGASLMREHMWFGEMIGRMAHEFLGRNELQVDVIGSHGHTLFHDPHQGLTFQLGHGQALASECGFPVVWDFRTMDVILGGQGAPLVPIGDRLLFGNYDACLNLGGFSNISFEREGDRIAFDVCPVNIALNHIAQRIGLEYDDRGLIAEGGAVNNSLLQSLDALEYYAEPGPKSLSREWFASKMLPLLDLSIATEDLLATLCHHMGHQIDTALNSNTIRNVLITGGGVHNNFLLHKIKSGTECQCIIPASDLVNLKEAVIFAFLAVLHLRHEVNVLSSVTGSARDHCAGILSLP